MKLTTPEEAKATFYREGHTSEEEYEAINGPIWTAPLTDRLAAYIEAFGFDAKRDSYNTLPDGSLDLFGPRLRRFSVEVPDGCPACTVLAVGLLNWLAVNWGVSLSSTSRFCVPLSFSSCASTTVTGVGAR